MAAGIYKITNLANGKVYVGQTIDFKRRYRDHFSDLYRGTHNNDRLQMDYNQYGRRKFTFNILQKINLSNDPIEDKDVLTARELWWIDHYRGDDLECGYNKKTQLYRSLSSKEFLPIKSEPHFLIQHSSLESVTFNQDQRLFSVMLPNGSIFITKNLQKLFSDLSFSSYPLALNDIITKFHEGALITEVAYADRRKYASRLTGSCFHIEIQYASPRSRRQYKEYFDKLRDSKIESES